MTAGRQASSLADWRRVLVGCVAVAAVASPVVAQQNSVHPQPRAEQLPSPAKATANANRRVPQPEGTLPKVPAGFSVASYAELRGPRMMVYAPNGDLFVSSPSTNSIFVLRDANNDGVFEARGVFADGQTAPAPAPPPAAADGRPAPVLGVLEGPQSLVPNPPACTPPPDYPRRGPGGLRLPFGLAFHGGYLYVGNTDSIVRFEYRSGDLQCAGRAGETARLADRGTLDAQHRVQSRRHEAVHRRRLGIEQRRRRRLPPRGHSRSQP